MNNTPKNQGQQQPNSGKQKRRQSINKTQLLGNVGQDPEIIVKTDGNNKPRVIARLSLAVDKSYYDQVTGELVPKTNWIPIVAYNRTAEIIRDFVKKGDLLQIVDGRIDQSEYIDKNNGQKRYGFAVIADRVLLMGARKEQGSPHDDLQHPVEDFDPNDFDEDIPM